jgi:hypothetical protein
MTFGHCTTQPSKSPKQNKKTKRNKKQKTKKRSDFPPKNNKRRA